MMHLAAGQGDWREIVIVGAGLLAFDALSKFGCGCLGYLEIMCDLEPMACLVALRTRPAKPKTEDVLYWICVSG